MGIINLVFGNLCERFQTQDSLDYEKWSEQNAVLYEIAKLKRRDDLHEAAAVSADPDEYESNYDAVLAGLEAGLRGTYRKAWNFIIPITDDYEEEWEWEEWQDEIQHQTHQSGFIIGRTFAEVRKKLESLPNRI